MSAQSVTDTESDVAVEDGPGHRLRAARESKKLSFSQVAAELHLGEDVVRALERDEYESLAGPVFVQGYLRKYARLLGESEELTIQAYHQLAPTGHRHRPAAGVPLAPEKRGGSLFGRMLMLLVLIIVIGMAVWRWDDLKWMLQPASQEAEAPASVAAQDSTEAAPEATPQAEVVGAPEAEPPVPEPELPPEVTAVEAAVEAAEPMQVPETAEPQVEITPSVDQPAEIQEPVAEPEPELAVEAGGAEQGVTSGIVLEFNAACWVDIRDSSGKFKLLGNVPTGASRVLGGTPPYKVILGNSQAVKISIDGKPFDLAPYSQGNVARFTLDPEQMTAP